MNNILFIGSLSSCQGTGRYKSFIKIFGLKNVNYFEPYKLLSSYLKKYEMALCYKFGAGNKVDKIINNFLNSIYQESYFKFIWIETPELLGNNSLKFLKDRSKYIHLYGNDNPFEGKQKRRFSLFHSSIKNYSSMCFMRNSSVLNAQALSKVNIFREYCTANLGTQGDNMETIIGNSSLFMTGSHIAHDCVIGNNTIFANQATLGGHVYVESNAVIGGISAVHQFCKIGSLAMIGGMSAVESDVIPYSLAIGNRAKITGINIVGLKRAKYSKEQIREYSNVVEKILTSGSINKEKEKFSI